MTNLSRTAPDVKKKRKEESNLSSKSVVKVKGLGYNTTREAVEDMAAHGIKPPEISENLCLDLKTVKKYLDIKDKARENDVRNLTSKEVLEIYHADGVYREIAKKYGLSTSQVGCLKLCQLRKDVLGGLKPNRKRESRYQKKTTKKAKLPKRECACCQKIFRPEGKFFTRCPDCRRNHKQNMSLETEYSIGVRGWIG